MEQARVAANENAVEEAEAELAQTLAEENVAEAAEEASAEECLKKKAVDAKKKKKAAILSAHPTIDPNEDIYLAVFHAGAPLEMLGDLAQLEA